MLFLALRSLGLGAVAILLLLSTRPLSAQNVGIGTSSPAAKLHVSDDIRSDGVVYWGLSQTRSETRNNAGAFGVGVRSGFYETNNPTPAANWPTGATGWWHLLDVRHHNTTNNYAMQMAGSFTDQRFFVRKTNNTANQPWRELVTLNQSAAPSTGQVIKWNGFEWAPANDLGSVYTFDNGLTETAGNVQLGGDLIQPTTVTLLDANDMQWDIDDQANFLVTVKGQEAFRVTDNQTVGIKNASPVFPLDVGGDIRSTSDIRADGSAYWGNALTRSETRNNAGAFGVGVRSGFYETSNPTPAANWPTGATGWWHLLDVRHSNTTNNYAMQMAGAFADQRFFVRKTNNLANQPWRELVTLNQSAAPSIGQVIKWNGSEWAPANDNNTTYTFDNGLTETAGNVRLGGDLIQPTTVTLDDHDMLWDINKTGEFRVEAGSNETFRVAANGNVGIRNANPAYQLHVSGRVGIRHAAGFGGLLNIGQTNTDYVPSGPANFPANWNANIILTGLDNSSISFHDANNRVDNLRVGSGVFHIGENVGWGPANTQVHGFLGIGGPPNTGARLYVHGNGYILNNFTVNGNTTLKDDALAEKDLFIDGRPYWGVNYSRSELRNDAGLFGPTAQSGFYQTSNPTPAANWPTGATGWWHLLDVRHSNTTNNYAMQMAGGFFDQRFFVRKTNNLANQPWRELVTLNQSAAPSTGQVIKWNGSEWAPANDNNTTYTFDNGLTESAGNVQLGGDLIQPTTVTLLDANDMQWDIDDQANFLVTVKDQETFRVTANQTVGILNASPVFPLDVGGDIRSTSDIRADGSAYWGNALTRSETRNNAGAFGVGVRSGFYETNNPTPAANWPTGATGWWHLLDVRHSNATNNYAMQMAGAFADQRFFVRKTNNLASQPWRELVTLNQSAAPSTGQVIKWNGSEWAPANDNNTTYTFDNGLTETAGNVRLGGALVQNTAVGLGTNTMTWSLTMGGGDFIIQRLPAIPILRATSAGNVGIGTGTPTERLHVSGNARVDGSVFLPTGQNVWIGGTTVGTDRLRLHLLGADGFIDYGMGNLFIRPNGNPEFTLTQIGHLGIGTGAPTERLHTTGNIRADGVVFWGNGLTRSETRNDAGAFGGGVRSGFYETSAPAPAANWPTGATGWWHLLDVRHSNSINNYAMQMAGSFFDQRFFVRKTNNLANQPWLELLTSANGWMTTGNAGTVPTVNFLGTTDLQPLVMRTNNIERLRVTQGGFVGIGQANPTAPVHVSTPTTTTSFTFQSGAVLTLTNYDVVGGIYSHTPTNITNTSNTTFHAAIVGRTPDTTYTGPLAPAAGVMATTRDYSRKLAGFTHFNPNTPTLRFNRSGLSNLQSILRNFSPNGPGWRGEDYGSLLGVNMFYDGTNYYAHNYCMPSIGLAMFGGGGSASASGYTPYFSFFFRPEADGPNCQLLSNFTPIEGIRITPVFPTFPGTPQIRMGIGTTTPDQLLTVNGNASKPGGGNWATFSDERLKTDIQPFDYGLDAIRNINTVHYRYAPDNALNLPSLKTHVGFIAQEVADVIPDAVEMGEHGYLILHGDPIYAALINAVKTLDAQATKQFEDLESEIQSLRANKSSDNQVQQQIQALADQVKSLQGQIDALRSSLSVFQNTSSEHVHLIQR